MKNFLLNSSKYISFLKYDYSKTENLNFSIVIPVYQRADALNGLLESIKIQNIKASEFEIVIVDNTGFLPQESEIASCIREYTDLPIRYFCNETNIGMASNWNRCFELARSEWVFMIHSDDLLCYKAIENILYVIEHYTSSYQCFYFGRKAILYSDESVENILINNIYKRFFAISPYKKIDFLYGTVPCAPTGILLQKKVFLELGGFNCELAAYPLDLEFVFRMMSHNFHIAKVSKICVLKREGKNDTMTSTEQYRISWINAIGNLIKSNIRTDTCFKHYLYQMTMNEICVWGNISPILLNKNLQVKICTKYQKHIYRILRKLHVYIRYLL